MNNFCQKALLVTTLAFGLTEISSEFAIANSLQSKSLSSVTPDWEHNQSLLITQGRQMCQAVSSDYQNVYAFETRNYYINICRRDDNQFFYYREPKSNPEAAILLKAETVFNGEVFQAVNGRVTYFVGINSDGYYSSVMQSNNEMIFEPELNSSSVVNRRSSNSNSSVQMVLETTDNSNSLNSGIESEQICTGDKNNSHPRLTEWQALIGEDSARIDEYAAQKGHSFSYDTDNYHNVIIETTDGYLVTLNLGQETDKVARVCVSSN